MYRAIFIILPLILASCSGGSFVSPPVTPTATKLVIAGWAGYVPQTILDAFSAETGIAVEYVIYEEQSAAIAQLRAGADYDLVVMGSYFLPRLIGDGLLAPLDYGQIPNHRNISINFHDLSYDPGNRYSVVYQWGVGGLIVRPDLLDRPITRWADLWDPALAGKIAMWVTEDDLFAITLKAMGQPVNTTDRSVLAEAAERISTLLPNIVALDPMMPNAADLLANGTYPIVYGWSFDAIAGHALNPAVEFVFPEEGPIFWIDTLIVPKASTRQAAAFQFINFVLRPEISAQITNEIYVATANERAMSLIDPALRDHPWIFPGRIMLKAEYLSEPPVDIKAYRHQLWEQIATTQRVR